ncbi:putative EPM2A (laforin) interacting protein 1 [Trypoxylus dichotomus]
MYPEKVNLFKSVSLLANTVARKVQDIAENISSQLPHRSGHLEWFFLTLDESADVSDTAQLLIFIRGGGKNKGAVALVSKAVENGGPLVLHCIIHQQSLCGKCLDMSEVLKPVMSV